MKNLKISLNVSHKFDEFESEQFKVIGSSSRPGEQDLLYGIHETKLYIITIPDLKVKYKIDIDSIRPNCGPNTIIECIYNDIFEEIHLFFETGEIITLKVQNGQITSVNVEFINEGFIKIKWSPNLEIGVVLNKLNQILTINSSFQVLNTSDLLSLDEGEKSNINVGWGKKETQFKGRAGKTIIKEETINDNDIKNDLTTNITWRGDSFMFAVNYYCIESNKRKIKIFDKDGVLQSTGEDLPGLEAPICWRPQGNLISFTQRFLNRYVVGFMEKNGLKHGDFNLSKNSKVIELDWNVLSNILSITSFSEKNEYTLSFWTTGNYHWYLKNSYKFDQKPTIVWDESKENRLFIITEGGKIRILEFIWSIDHSTYKQQTSLISVIDNDSILLTPFDKTIIPPPMSQWTLKCDASVNQILYCPDFKKGNDDWFLCAVTANNQLLFFEMSDEIPSLSQTFQIPFDDDFDSILGLWEWISKDTLVCCTSNVKTGFTDLSTIKINEKCILSHVKHLENIITSVTANNQKALLQTNQNDYFEFDPVTNEMIPYEAFPELCTTISSIDGQIYGLSEKKHLYSNETIIATDVTSFFIKKPYILATTSHHTLMILKIEDKTFEEVTLRKLERGSKIILITGNSVIMQLPRGNLETIQPRALTILTIGSLLDKTLYPEALQLLRKQRISFDLCVDHDSNKFLSNVDKFVDEIDQQWITLLVTDLNDNDTTKNVYSSYYSQDRKSLDDKVKVVSNAILDALIKQNDNKNTPAKLSCLVKLKRMGEAIELANDTSFLEHLLFLVNIESLYNEALGCYNLTAALKIAEKSQMDPKEYVPYLNGLLELEPNYMKYTIDRTLKRPQSALTHISKCGEEKMDECYILIKEYGLYSLALEIFENNPERYKCVASLFGESLYKKRHFEESGLMYIRAGDNKQAIESFIKSGNWRQSVLTAKQCSFTNEDIKRMGESLYDGLISSEDYIEAANVACECLKDFHRSIQAYILGKYWQQAIYEANKNDSASSLDFIKQSVLDASVYAIEDINTKNNLIKHYLDRLQVVRKQKESRPKFRDFDEMSDTSSSSSYRSNQSFTSRSSKMSRKLSRKLWSLKEGNPREEEGLMSAIKDLMMVAEKITKEISNISITLVYFKEDKIGKTLQSVTKAMVQTIEEAKKIVWPKDPNDDEVAIMDQKLKFSPDLKIPKNWELEAIKD